MAPDLITLDAEGEAGRITVGNDVIPSPGAAFVSLPELPAMQEEQLTLQPALPGMLKHPLHNPTRNLFPGAGVPCFAQPKLLPEPLPKAKTRPACFQPGFSQWNNNLTPWRQRE